ncbi:hypothetical protein PPACK8108_LOCUS14172 [Phakopsora pachyrhizi]|uniref:Tet-like 2OG-Fe(II) oxygenase domain-containing protein n=1 Tax=Phakopsora pachyrhizi TaxID=170000 RepID=A0AAV0B7E1_PHAPC|nr:hypothetical protein PPACK8108_LOCUS14172 [Phakopsora pachyrhizi]
MDDIFALAGLPEDRGHKGDGYGRSGGQAWMGDRRQWCEEEAGRGCGGRFGKRGQGKGGAESFCWILQGFEEEEVAVEENGWRHWKEGQKLGGGGHQGQSGWSKTTGATDFFKEAPDLECNEKQEDYWSDPLMRKRIVRLQRRKIPSGAYESYKSYLEEHLLPSLYQMNFNQKDNYCPEDFSSAITYTINYFSNKTHVDNDSDNWTLIGFIPIRKNGKIAYKDFDVEGGKFVMRDLQVFIELPRVEGITLVVLKTSDLKHQTLPSKSTSDLFTRFGFSCKISKNMTNTMEKFHNHHYEGMNHTFGNYDNYIKKANEK